MSDQNAGLTYKGRPLMRKDNMIYYGSMADSHIVMLQVLESKKGKRAGCRHPRVGSASAERPEPQVPGNASSKRAKKTACTRRWMLAVSGWSALWQNKSICKTEGNV
ncbi:MAG: hypothetical protein ACLVHV_14825 [Oscillospiraceae bacterium]